MVAVINIMDGVHLILVPLIICRIHSFSQSPVHRQVGGGGAYSKIPPLPVGRKWWGPTRLSRLLAGETVTGDRVKVTWGPHSWLALLPQPHPVPPLPCYGIMYTSPQLSNPKWHN